MMVTKDKNNDNKFEVYKKLLLEIKEKISGDIRDLSEENTGSGNDRGGDVSGHALHMADVATDMYDREFTLGLAANDRELLFQVEEALSRIQEGDYGICVSCKKPIPATRLKALPHTQNCMKCQELRETKRR
ncbi:MAG: TraR/DksA family transcriptional regulator [Candidatus Omnitrophica bacterium]|nr:TraR/DksA family transcriptional regulator [Candidatus Omnitrophota bacterium]